MATVRDIVTRALKRGGIVDAAESPAGPDMSDAIDALNDLMYAWKAEGVDIAHQGWSVSDTFNWFVPPADMTSSVLASLSYQGTWNASTNTPTLTSGTGTEGYLYKVSAAGSTTLDSVTLWSVGDFAIFDGSVWLKGQSSRQFDGAVVAILALRLSEDYGQEPGATVVKDARDGWALIQSKFVLPYSAQFETSLFRVPSKRYYDF